MAAYQKIGAALLAAALFFCALPAFASETGLSEGHSVGYSLGASNVVYSQGELRDWCSANMQGGTVYLGCDVTLTKNLAPYGARAIVIDTGPHSLIWDNSCIKEDIISLTGEGVDRPVLDIIAPYAFRSSWLHAVQPLRVTATGRDGIGGTAVRLRSGNTWKPNMSWLQTEGAIRSYGAGAVGIRFDVPLDTYCLNVRVEGENSTAVIAPDGMNLYFCKLSAVGEGAAVVNSGDILLDACAASPKPDGVKWVTRRAEWPTGLYYPAKQGMRINKHSSIMEIVLEFLSEDDAYEHTLLMAWDWQAVDNIDTSQPGLYKIYGDFPPPFRGLGLEGTEPLFFELDVRDTSLPCIDRAKLTVDRETQQTLIMLFYWGEMAGKELRLWRADGLDGEWYDTSDDPAVEWYDSCDITIEYTEITDPIFFCLEHPETGFSNIVAVTNDNGKVEVNRGGDRTGVDRGGAGDDDDDDPAIPPPPPDDNDDDDPAIPPPPPGDDDDDDPAIPPPPPGDDDDDTPPPTPPGPKSPPPASGQSGGGRGASAGNGRLPEAPDAQPMRAEQAAEETAAQQTPAMAPQPSEEVPPAAALPDEPPRPADLLRFTGAEIEALTQANPVQVTFIRHGVRVVVPADALAALTLRPDQELVVAVQPVEGGYAVRFLLDGEKTALPYTLHQPDEPGQPAVLEVSDTVSMGAQKQISVDIEPEKSARPLVVLVAGGVLAIGGLAVLLRRRLSI